MAIEIKTNQDQVKLTIQLPINLHFKSSVATFGWCLLYRTVRNDRIFPLSLKVLLDSIGLEWAMLRTMTKGTRGWGWDLKPTWVLWGVIPGQTHCSSTLLVRDQNERAVSEVRRTEVIFSLFQVLFLPVDTLWASLCAFWLWFLLSGFPTPDFLSYSPSPHTSISSLSSSSKRLV